MIRFAALLLLTLTANVGCGDNESMPKFIGEPQPRVMFDLVGEWNISSYQTEERPTKKGEKPFNARWVLERDSNLFVWNDVNGQGAIELVGVDDGQFLKWTKPDTSVEWLAIRDWSFGCFRELRGSDGRSYLAVRIEGGQDAPHLKYADGFVWEEYVIPEETKNLAVTLGAARGLTDKFPRVIIDGVKLERSSKRPSEYVYFGTDERAMFMNYNPPGVWPDWRLAEKNRINKETGAKELYRVGKGWIPYVGQEKQSD